MEIGKNPTTGSKGSVQARNFSFGAQGPLPSKKLGTIEKIWGQHNFFLFVFDTKRTSHDIIFPYHIQAMGTIITTVLESHDLLDYFLFHLFLVCHVRFLPQQLGVKGQIDHLSIGRGLSSLSLVEDPVVSPLDRLGKKLNIDRSFLLCSAMTTYQQYCASDHVLSIHET